MKTYCNIPNRINGKGNTFHSPVTAIHSRTIPEQLLNFNVPQENTSFCLTFPTKVVIYSHGLISPSINQPSNLNGYVIFTSIDCYNFISSFLFSSIQKIHQTLETLFHISKYFGDRQKYSAARRTFSFLVGVWRWANTQSLMFDILHEVMHLSNVKLLSCFAFLWFQSMTKKRSYKNTEYNITQEEVPC